VKTHVFWSFFVFAGWMFDFVLATFALMLLDRPHIPDNIIEIIETTFHLLQKNLKAD
jgi:hypothetical protein